VRSLWLNVCFQTNECRFCCTYRYTERPKESVFPTSPVLWFMNFRRTPVVNEACCRPNDAFKVDMAFSRHKEEICPE
jgi:hypothetical protein